MYTYSIHFFYYHNSMPRKTDSKTRKKIIQIKLQDPDKSLRDIWNEIWVWRNAVANVLKEIPEEIKASSDKANNMIEALDDIVETITRITQKNLVKYEQAEVLSVKDTKALNDIAKTNWERNQILKWKPTAISHIDIKDIHTKTPKELEEMRKSLLQG